MTLTYDDKNHIYRVDGAIYPSVTQILNDMGMTDFSAVPADVLERAQKFGTAVHKATELYDVQDLDFKNLDTAVVPYIEAWAKFKDDYKVRILQIEKAGFDSTFRYAGRVDRLGKIGDLGALIDIKTSTALAPATAIQTAAYARMFEPFQFERYGVQLKNDGTYAVTHYNAYGDLSLFLSAVSLWWWRKNNKLIKEAV